MGIGKETGEVAGYIVAKMIGGNVNAKTKEECQRESSKEKIYIKLPTEVRRVPNLSLIHISEPTRPY